MSPNPPPRQNPEISKRKSCCVKSRHSQPLSTQSLTLVHGSLPIRQRDTKPSRKAKRPREGKDPLCHRRLLWAPRLRLGDIRSSAADAWSCIDRPLPLTRGYGFCGQAGRSEPRCHRALRRGIQFRLHNGEVGCQKGGKQP